MKKLTKNIKIDNEKQRISQLTHVHNAYFKIILSHQIENHFPFKQIMDSNGKIVSSDQVKALAFAFGDFLKDCLNLTITEVENKYERKTYVGDGTYDPETRLPVQVEHFCLYDQKENPPVNLLSDCARIHGYFRPTGGYFVITRFDWFHAYNHRHD